jgi:FkbM family methyltransferase
MTGVLRRVARVLPTQSRVRRGLSRAWDSLLGATGRHVAVPWAGQTFRLQVPFRHLDPAFESAAAAAWTKLLEPGDTAWDIGANIGLYTLLTGQVVGPGGRVVAWEPSPATFAVLADHIAANGMASWCQPIHAAVADQTGGRMAMTVDPACLGNSTDRLGQTGQGQVVQVEVGTMDGFAATLGHRPRAIKVDIEGAEVLALRGAAGLLAPGPHERPALMIAVHPMFLPEFGCSTTDLEEVVARYDYRCWTLDGRPARPVEYAEYLLLPPEREDALLQRVRG